MPSSLLAIVLAGGCGSKREPAYPGMVWIAGGTFTMGAEGGMPDEAPRHEVRLDGFWMDETEVTNREFERFVTATQYKTMAERTPDAKDFPGVPKERLVPGALVFRDKQWDYVAGASWKSPEGPGSSIAARMDHPVVQVCWDDALAYAKWAGKALPTEAQYEFAARGSQSDSIYPWGTQAPGVGKPVANIWQGTFPDRNEERDGFSATAPVGSFPANPYGLHDLGGNVWEWCSDWYRPNYKDAGMVNPTGPNSSFDPAEPDQPKRVVRGGSFLCSENYCRGYRNTARMKTSPDTALSHTGFRCVINPDRR